MEQRYLSSTFEYIVQNYIEEDKREALNNFLSLIQSFEYAVVGGVAVSVWYNGVRAISPEDFDVKILPSEEKQLLKVLKENGFKLERKNAFMDSLWFVFKKDGQGFDVGIVEKEWDIIGIKTAKSFNYKGHLVKVIPIEYLIVSKLFAGRRKDYKDVVFLLKSGKVDFQTIRIAVKRFIPSELEELENLIIYAKQFDVKDINKLFEELQDGEEK
ncbi:hypothetical protein [Sulfurihydrogenibium azorense]|uniref:Nucleotidyltransferase family protein n=1 Tax=Sulfurihydrogenibium azorense (strain DSM 15241 / OCM 825 / Az-Fu1) TaxID=204536 RepID=C1DU90_SULAA|nr:hypothetical protein [Sulfurihydrogenibium azorense]ACN98842.1 conserved hypothetical protein [Sulfurihydrogenibium azorense Az-Fu1]